MSSDPYFDVNSENAARFVTSHDISFLEYLSLPYLPFSFCGADNILEDGNGSIDPFTHARVEEL